MTFRIVESSPQATELGTELVKRKKASMYPFDELEVGQSFVVNLEEVNWKSLRTMVYQNNKKGEAQFVFVKHDEVAEVARVV